MLLEIGEKVHVATRRRFEGDVRRHFVGEVVSVEGALARLSGYAFVFDPNRDDYIRYSEKRVRILDLSDVGNVTNILPRDTTLEEVTYTLEDRKLMVTDGKNLKLDINEFGPYR